MTMKLIVNDIFLLKNRNGIIIRKIVSREFPVALSPLHDLERRSRFHPYMIWKGGLLTLKGGQRRVELDNRSA